MVVTNYALMELKAHFVVHNPIAGEILGPRGKFMTVHQNCFNMPSKYIYAKRKMVLPTLMREVSLCNEMW